MSIPETAEGRFKALEQRELIAAKPARDQLALLLTVARILRAKIANEVYAEQRGDLEALNEALLPFDFANMTGLLVPVEPKYEAMGCGPHPRSEHVPGWGIWFGA